MIKQIQFADIRSPGVKGLNEGDEIEDQELADAVNVVFDGNIISPRPGSSLFAAAPQGEAGDPLQTMVAETSDGIDYLLAIYGNHFYLYHPTNEEWIRINNTYVPTETARIYGWQVWNNGRGDDRHYVCNGVDNFARWDVCVDTANGAQSSGAASFTINDATRFPATGTLVIKGSGGVFTEAYSAKIGNTFTLTGTLSDDVADGASVTLEMVEKDGMEIGKVLCKHGGRLFTANYYGGETTVWYSKLHDPENFTTGSNIGDASTAVIADGNGEITGMHDFGDYMIIEKEDSIHRLRIIVSQDLASKLDEIKPIVSSRSLGPLGMESTLKMQNTLMFPTRSEGIMSLKPISSGDVPSVGLELLSKKIQLYTTDSVEYTTCRGTLYKQKALWAVSRRNSQQNSIVMMYDTVRSAWSKIENWAVKDWAYMNGKLYYMSIGDGNIYECFTRTFNDVNNYYPVSFHMKRFDFGVMSMPKTQSLIYVKGLITPGAKLYCDILFNENGELGKQTFLITLNTDGVLVSSPLTNAMGQPQLGNTSLGYVKSLEIGDVYSFRTYLGVKIGSGFYNIQPRFYSNTPGFWGISGVGFAPDLEVVIPNLMVLSPVA